nr:unnamed protein product [Callosobruchus analis]
MEDFSKMSHSDSEIKDDVMDKVRRLKKQLHIEFKAKRKLRTPEDIRKFRRKIEPLYHEIRLVQAVNSHNTEEVKKLLECGVSANSTDTEKRSALHVAVSKGRSSFKVASQLDSRREIAIKLPESESCPLKGRLQDTNIIVTLIIRCSTSLQNIIRYYLNKVFASKSEEGKQVKAFYVDIGNQIKLRASVLAQHYEVSWVTDVRLRFFRNIFNLEDANQEKDHPDDVEEKALVILSDAEDNDLRIWLCLLIQ